jgi:hypothetical protein
MGDMMGNPFETIPGDRAQSESRNCDKCKGTGKVNGKNAINEMVLGS